MALSGPVFTSEEKSKFMSIIKISDASEKKATILALPSEERVKFMQFYKVAQEQSARLQRAKDSYEDKMRQISELEERRSVLETREREILTGFGKSVAPELRSVTPQDSTPSNFSKPSFQ